MGLFSNLFGPPDSTRDWPQAVDGVLPEVDLNARTFGSLRFGDGLDSAYFLGKPDRSKPTRDCHDLYYDRLGFVVSFELNRFVELRFDIIPETGSRARPAQPRATGGVIFTPETSRQDLERHYGSPSENESYGTYDIVQYVHGPLISEFEYDLKTEKLSGWTVYLNE